MSAITSFLDGRVTLHAGDCREVVAYLPDASIDSCVSDPPYALVSIGKRFGKPGSAPAVHGKDGLYARASAGFMGKQWDTGEVAFDPTFWAEVYRVLKPGAHLVAFGGTRSYHRLACAIEDAGFEIRDQLGWAYGTGFPKSHDVSKALDKVAGHWRGRAGDVKIESQPAKGTEYKRTDKGSPITAAAAAAAAAGWGTSLKPAWEPIVLARKPISGTVAENFVEHGTGALNIDGCRIEGSDAPEGRLRHGGVIAGAGTSYELPDSRGEMPAGRWPANIIHDGSEEVVALFPSPHGAGVARDEPGGGEFKSDKGWGNIGAGTKGFRIGDSGSAARFFYSAKADSDDRIGSKHPTVKPVDLMQWLCRLITPSGGTVLDPFAGTGTTGEAAWREGFSAVLIEREAEYRADIARRMELAIAGPRERANTITKVRGKVEAPGGLFGSAAE